MNFRYRIICISLLLIVIYHPVHVQGANILVILPTSIPSHIRSFKFLLQALADEHNITFYGLPLNLNNKNITEKKISIDMDSYLEDFSANIFQTTCKKSVIGLIMNEVLWLNYNFYNQMFTGSDIKDLIKDSNSYFDLMITVAHTAEMFLPLAHKFNIPVVQFATSVPCPWSYELIGNPTFYASDLSFITYEMPTNFLQRITKFIKHSIISIHYKWRYLPFLNQIALQHFPPGTPNLEEISKRTALLFMNYQSKMGYARTNVPAAVEIGGLHCTPAKPLPPDLEEFMQSSNENGVIYFSLGSTLKGMSLPDRIRREILEVFKKLPQKILWKWEGNMSNLPTNVKISKWVPQQDVLGHKKLRLFITQGGMLSTQEAAYHGVPLLMMPLILDQYTNAAVVEQNGYGLQIDYCNFNKDEFNDKIKQIFQDPKFSKKAKEISLTLKDSPWEPKEQIKWWINYIVRHKNTENLRPMNLSYVQYSELDIHFALFIITSILFYIIYLILLKLKAIWKNTKKVKTQ